MSTMSKDAKKLSYFREVQNELKKVSWTSKPELITSTKAVIIATFVFGFSIYLTDLAVRGFLDGVGYVARLVFG